MHGEGTSTASTALSHQPLRLAQIALKQQALVQATGKRREAVEKEQQQTQTHHAVLDGGGPAPSEPKIWRLHIPCHGVSKAG